MMQVRAVMDHLDERGAVRRLDPDHLDLAAVAHTHSDTIGCSAMIVTKHRGQAYNVSPSFDVQRDVACSPQRQRISDGGAGVSGATWTRAQ
jgi:hypothetical protein